MEKSGVSAQTITQESGIVKNTRSAMDKASYIISAIGLCLFRLRKFVLAGPVVFYALKLADYNRTHLPAVVGINLQSSGEFAMTIDRSLAVMGPLGLTVACLLLMFCSRKALYPWAISIFTLVLPVLLLVSNIYPS